MIAPHLVLIYGTSIFLLAVGAQLAREPGVVVEYGQPQDAYPPPRLPHVVLFQRGQPPGQGWSLLQAGVPLLELDASQAEVTLYHRDRHRLEQVTDFQTLFCALREG